MGSTIAGITGFQKTDKLGSLLPSLPAMSDTVGALGRAGSIIPAHRSSRPVGATRERGYTGSKATVDMVRGTMSPRKRPNPAPSHGPGEELDPSSYILPLISLFLKLQRNKG